MKILKIIFPLFLISLFYIPNVSASTTTYNGTLKYDEIVLTAVDTYESRLNGLRTYLTNHNCFTLTNVGTYCLDSGNFVVAIDTTTMSSNSWTIYLMEVNNTTNDFINFWWRSGNDYDYGQFNFGGSGAQITINYTTNPNNPNVRSSTVVGGGSYSYNKWFYASNDINPMSSDIEVLINNRYFDTSWLDSTKNIVYKERGTPFLDIPLYNGSGMYAIPEVYMNAKNFFDSFVPTPPVPNPYTCSLDMSSITDGFRDGVVSNISDFSFDITANNLSPDDFCIESQFALWNSLSDINDSSFNSSSNWNIEVIKGPNSDGDYHVDGEVLWDNSTKVLSVSYSVCATGDTVANVDAIIKVIPISNNAKSYFSGKLNIIYCPFNNDIIDSFGASGGYAYTDSTTGLTNSYDTSLMNFLSNSNVNGINPFSNIVSIIPAGPIDSVLNIPLQVLNALVIALSGQCSNVSIPLPYINSNLTISCINGFYTSIGASSFVNSVGLIASILMLINYFIFLYNWLDDVFRLSHKKVKSWGTGEV